MGQPMGNTFSLFLLNETIFYADGFGFPQGFNGFLATPSNFTCFEKIRPHQADILSLRTVGYPNVSAKLRLPYAHF